MRIPGHLRRTVLAGAAIAAALVALGLPRQGDAQATLPEAGPLPYARTGQGSPPPIDRMLSTGTIAAPDVPVPDGSSIETGPLADGLTALAQGDVDTARAQRSRLPAQSFDRQVLTWAIATSGLPGVRSGEIAAAARTLAGWPGAGTLRDNSERALLREDPSPGVVLRAFGDTEPRTPEGTIVLARAHLSTGDAAGAIAVIAPLWRMQRLEPRLEQAIIAEFGALIPASDHRFRMERMLYADRLTSVDRVAGLAGATELAAAFAAVTRNARDAASLLDAVPAGQRSAAHVFATARHLRRTGRFREAATVMLGAPTDAEALIDPDAWWVERRVLSRELLDIDDAATAYRLAAAHAAESPVMAADAEFHAGWYAFRGLGDAAAGARHFGRIAQIAEGPISLARAHYWLGRAAEAGGEGDSAAHFERAAAFGTTFYGQLAAARLGRTTALGQPAQPGDADRLAFAQRPGVRAIERLQAVGQGRLAERLYRETAEQLTSVGELTLLAGLAEAQGNHMLALRVGKWAAGRGIDVGTLAHPTGAIPPDADISGAGLALAYAIARQESEFNVAARSGVGALGILQLMPATAREMARQSGLAYTQSRLTTDAAYNATLGARYLDEQLARFDGSYILTFAGYNAGPARAREWMERYGDPRGQPLDAVVDWIERIPYTETRSYVQRVMENYQVYKMRLHGRMDIENDLVDGR